MEFIKQFLFSILPLVLIFAIPLIAILSYRLIRRKLGSARGVKTVSPEIENITINPKYYNWLSCSLIGSFILFGWFIYAKGGDRSNPENIRDYEYYLEKGIKVECGVGGTFKIESSSNVLDTWFKKKQKTL